MTFLTQHPWIIIIIGTIFVGSGGLIATWGWNQNTELKSKDNLIAAVVEEWKLNDRMINDAISLAKRWNQRDTTENFSYQSFKTGRGVALISSGNFSQKEDSLVSAIQKYEYAIGEMMAYLRIAGRCNPGIFINKDLIHNPPTEIPKEEKDIFSQQFFNVINSHRQLGNVLKRKTKNELF